MSGIKQFDRQYRFAAGRAKGVGFEIGETSAEYPTALRISFTVDKTDAETPNTAQISLWNLNQEHLSMLNEPDCVVTLRAGYGKHMALIFVGVITYIETSLDKGDKETRLEAVDGGIELRDSFVSLSYAGVISTKKIIEDVATEMGVALTFSYNAQFSDLANGFTCVGQARVALDKACAESGLQWQLSNGVLLVKKKNDVMSREVYELTPESGLIGLPKKITYGKDASNEGEQSGYEVEYFMNGAIGMGDFIRLESRVTQGYFRIRSIQLIGDNIDGDWMCIAKLIEAS